MNQDENMKDGKYEEALERAKELHESGNVLTKLQMEIVSPELKENKDEMIRKSLVKFFRKFKQPQDMWDEMFSCGDVLAYLERQKEQKMPEPEYGGENKRYPTEYRLDQDTRKKLIALVEKFGQEEDKEEMLDYLESYQPVQSASEVKEFNFQPGDPDEKAIKRLKAMIYFAFDETSEVPMDEACALDDWLDEKCKPAEWSEKDEKMMNEIITIMDGGKVTSETYLSEYVAFLKSLHERFNLQPKQEWSEEDEKMRIKIMSFLSSRCSVNEYEEIEDWFKSLRLQPKHFGNTYYDIIHNILDMLKNIDFMNITPEHRVSLLNDIRVKCKDADECAAILDEPHWKPSEEQMEALFLSGQAYETCGFTTRSSILKQLHDDLQKLL